ncbi:putative minor capsid protein [Streptococcus ruminantium]|uniref:putative minor capsid protein n=1 Tax=Streptococcus ruminantium TaxID=1917441 RepID=UPI0012DF0D83|nr:putative minor capsid protein [Streptococcus ruminantium]
MKIPKPARDMLNESVIYRPYEGEGDWNRPVYGEPVTINKVRIDRTAVYSASTGGKVLLYNAVIFCFAGITSPILSFKERSVLIFDNKEHVIQKVSPMKDPYSNDLYSVELEVI